MLLETLLIKHLKVALAHGKTHVYCFPGARVADVTKKVPSVLSEHKNLSNVVLHIGVNDIRQRKSEILKRDFISLVDSVRAFACDARIVVSGPLPMLRMSSEIFSRFSALNDWLLRWCSSVNI